MNFYVAIVTDETKIPKLVHKITHARACCPDHLGQHFLTEFSYDRLRPAFLAEIRKEKEKPGEPLLAQARAETAASLDGLPSSARRTQSRANSSNSWAGPDTACSRSSIRLTMQNISGNSLWLRRSIKNWRSTDAKSLSGNIKQDYKVFGA